jgi:hypothetical protein
LQLLSGVEITPITITCVESSGGYSLVVQGGSVIEHFTYVTLAASVVESVTEDDQEEPESPGYVLNGIYCNENPHASVTFNGFPSGAVSALVTITGDMGSANTIGPIAAAGETIVGQEYWFALNEDWEPVQEGEYFSILIEFKDENGDVVSSQTFTGYCQ